MTYSNQKWQTNLQELIAVVVNYMNIASLRSFQDRTGDDDGIKMKRRLTKPEVVVD